MRRDETQSLYDDWVDVIWVVVDMAAAGHKGKTVSLVFVLAGGLAE